ncbi:MAG: methyltransferase domain-containing protein [Candidatus Eremiobacteraeota bacterium]|nr:methyltransferase domain-containing protein [Candidatus Eremiobacteraeota bacterium]
MKKACASLSSRLRARTYLRGHPIRTDFPLPDYANLWSQLLLQPGIATEDYVVDRQRFSHWIRHANYPLSAYVVNRAEKRLEHHISAELLALPPGSLLIDVASAHSPFPAIMRRGGYRVIAQDLAFKPGLHGDRLGGDASRLELPNSCADGMTLHCSFEHFESSSDTRFIIEAARVLKSGGRVVILPLYLHQEYINMTDPLYSRVPVDFDEGASVVGAFGLANRYGRHYAVPAFLARVVEPAMQHGLRVTVVRVKNSDAISTKVYLRFALVLTKR